MSRDQLLRLLSAAESSPSLRRRLRLMDGWEPWLVEAQRLGFGVDANDLNEAQRLDRVSRFLNLSQLSPIKPLR